MGNLKEKRQIRRWVRNQKRLKIKRDNSRGKKIREMQENTNVNSRKLGKIRNRRERQENIETDKKKGRG